MNSKEVKGAKLTLTGKDSNGQPIVFKDGQLTIGEGGTEINSVGTSLVWLSGTEKTIVTVEDGTYTLEELAAPNGYEKASSITFTVEGGKVTTIDG